MKRIVLTLSLSVCVCGVCVCARVQVAIKIIDKTQLNPGSLQKVSVFVSSCGWELVLCLQ